ncbi:hypothetical protein [Mucilaginibacter sp. HD30]
MKKTYLSLIALFAALQVSFAQTNTFPASGNVGIGTTSPVNALNIVVNSLGYGDPQYASAVRVNDFGNGTGLLLGVASTLNNGYIQTVQPHVSWASRSLVLQPLDGNVGIGTTDTQGYKLAVNGSAIATSMKVKPNGSWPDFVFLKDYRLPTLTEVKTYIDKNQHLPDMPSADEVHTNGLDLGEMNRLLLKKVEELTLYLIEKDKQLSEQQVENKLQNQRINALEKAKTN